MQIKNHQESEIESVPCDIQIPLGNFPDLITLLGGVESVYERDSVLLFTGANAWSRPAVSLGKPKQLSYVEWQEPSVCFSSLPPPFPSPGGDRPAHATWPVVGSPN